MIKEHPYVPKIKKEDNPKPIEQENKSSSLNTDSVNASEVEDESTTKKIKSKNESGIKFPPSYNIYNTSCAIQFNSKPYKDEETKRLTIEVASVVPWKTRVYDWEKKWQIVLNTEEMIDFAVFLLKKPVYNSKANEEKVWFKIFHDPNAWTDKKGGANSSIDWILQDDGTFYLTIKVKNQHGNGSYAYKLTPQNAIIILAKILDALSENLNCEKSVIMSLILSAKFQPNLK